MAGTEMSDPEITTREEWLVARRVLLTKEKELSRHRDEVNAARRRLPMVEITKDYLFHGPDGEATLADLFDGRSQPHGVQQSPTAVPPRRVLT